MLHGITKLLGLNKRLRYPKCFIPLSSHDEFLQHRKRVDLKARTAKEIDYVPNHDSLPFTLHKLCYPCGKPQQLNIHYVIDTNIYYPNGKKMPNWREELVCPECGMNNRMRAAIHLFEKSLTQKCNKRIYMTEGITPTFNWINSRYPRVIGSEYWGPEYAGGQIVNGVRHENIVKLSFKDGRIGTVLSFDVLEHIPDYKAALSEIYRVLVKNGILLLSVPFVCDLEKNLLRAEILPDGSIKHHCPPEYHGNPTDPENGSLCFHYFGWELLDDLRNAKFRKAHALAYWSEDYGYFGTEQYIIIAQK